LGLALSSVTAGLAVAVRRSSPVLVEPMSCQLQTQEGITPLRV
jgi:hypothetical protein